MNAFAHGEKGPVAEVLDWLDWPLTAWHPIAGHHLIRVEEWVADGRYILRAELPGVDPEQDIDVTAASGILTIRAERRRDQQDRRHSEFRYGTFTRSVALPPGTDEGRIQATSGHGILEITADVRRDAAEQPTRHIPVLVNHHIKAT
ncbi:MAG TPA: Hsp20/alpha crystallin family protein [Streptosporangiaceae bacterium]|jgi:HSP20 family protein